MGKDNHKVEKRAQAAILTGLVAFLRWMTIAVGAETTSMKNNDKP